ncbi:MAG: YfjI family protein, partial [Pirellula staleyi]
MASENLPTVASPSDPWPEPMNVDRPSLPAFPVNTLPEPLRAWVVATAEAYQVPSDLPALLAMACCGGAAARRVEMLAGRGWIEPINLYVACLLEPANRKSAVFSAALRPLREIERELMEMAAPEVARLSSARRVKENKMKKAERKACDKSCDESAQLASVLAAELSNEPVATLPKLLVDDATAEAVEMQLAAQGGRLICAGAEGGLFDVMAGRYSSGVGNLDCFLKGHAGDDLRVDRVIRGSIVVDRCCLTLAYAIQPEVIRGMADRPSFRGRGLIGRFLYSLPETRLGKRSINSDPVSSHVAVCYSALVRRLASIQANGDEPRLLAMAPDATSCFYRWQVEVEGWLGDSGWLREMRDWGGKLCGLTARLAAILHLVETDSG